MILLTNGDSWTQGDSPSQTPNWSAKKSLKWYDIIPNFGYPVTSGYDRSILYKFYDSEIWPKVLGRKLGVETWNAGRLGDDNFTIVKRTINSIKYLKSIGKKDIFLVIGWTSKYRVPIIEKVEDTFHYTQLRPNEEGYDSLSLPLSEKVFTSDFFIYTHLLECFCKENNVEYLFFNAFDSCEKTSGIPIVEELNKDKWMNKDISSSHFKDYILKKFELTDWRDSDYFLCYHPTDISHIAWGNYLYEYIINNYEVTDKINTV